MKIKYSKEVDIYGQHKIIECKPCCDITAILIKEYITDKLIKSMVDKCPHCGKKIELIRI